MATTHTPLAPACCAFHAFSANLHAVTPAMLSVWGVQAGCFRFFTRNALGPRSARRMYVLSLSLRKSNLGVDSWGVKVSAGCARASKHDAH